MAIFQCELANIYLHELDKYMEQYTGLSKHEKRRRRERLGKANYQYTRYADDFVVLCNGTKAEAIAIREELLQFLKERLRLTLSMEKTKVTHINDGYKFLGYIIKRTTSEKGKEVVKLQIPKSAVKKVTEKIRRSTAPSTTNHSVNTKIIALNRIIGGWCRYYQYVSNPARKFSKIDQITYWAMAHWLARKYKTSIPKVIKRFNKGPFWATDTKSLTAPRMYKAIKYKARTIPNPYSINPEKIQREVTIEENGTGYERRPGAWDNRLEVLERDGYTCQKCGTSVTEAEAQVDHKRPWSRFKQPEVADSPDNCWTLCYPCHEQKTKFDRQAESRVR
jgi:5-methylcytosine-specific restriction endonuclease McrA